MIQRASLMAIGDEVLTGEIVNSNGAYLADKLMGAGVRPLSHQVVGDNAKVIANTVRRLLRQSDLVVTIGGLGPTADDRTVDAVATALGLPVVQDDVLYDHIATRHSRQLGWQESVARQARVLSGAVVWKNSVGQAPGQLIEHGDGFVVMLPGPPREFRSLVEQSLLPWLEQFSQDALERRTLSLFDWGESTVASYLGAFMHGSHPEVGIYSQPGRIDIRLESRADEAGRILLSRAEAWVRAQIPGRVYRLSGQNREDYLIPWLSSQSLTVGAMESLTGGLLLSRLIDVAGASAAVMGGIVAYTDQVKEHFGVRPDILEQYTAVSEETATAMAERAHVLFNTDIGIATTGYAGPSGGTSVHPVGTFFTAAWYHGRVVARRRYAPLDRQAIRQVAVETAISTLWDVLELPSQWD